MAFALAHNVTKKCWFNLTLFFSHFVIIWASILGLMFACYQPIIVVTCSVVRV
jgi:hypothetical protein